MNPFFRRSALGAAIGTLCLSAAAQTAGTLSEVTVTGNPLGSGDPIAPVQRLEGLDLMLRQQGSLGETLGHLPGVSSTHFGPTVSRPVIRGLDGDRIRILQGGGASVDASGLSFDHAVPIDPIAIDRVEVLRGPGALLYGGSAIGGVVNVIDSRIPREPLEGITGRADAGLASGNWEKSGALMLQAGNGRQVLHVDAFGRDSQDVHVPSAVPCEVDGTPRFRQRLCNTGAQARGAAVGGSTFFDRGRIGASVATYRNDYGSPAEESVDIGMRSDRFALDGQWRPPAGPIDSLRLQASHTDYRHTEFEDGEPGTRFANRGNDLRIEARHRPMGALSGVLGLQAEHTRFSADGDEAFAPYSRTRQLALFLHEELATRWGRLSLGLRQESVRVASDGNPAVDRFAIGEREFSPTSYALGALWKPAPGWELSAQAAHSERAPRDYELFANGPHVATAAWELGDASLGLERSNNVDLGLAWKRGADQWRINAFVHRFSNYVALRSTGASREVDPGEFLPELAYRGVPAQLAGWEASGQWRLRAGAPVLDLEWRADRVRGTDRSSREPLPRLPAMRLGATLVGRMGDWAARLGFDHAARQSRVPSGDAATPAYTLWHAALSRSQRAGPAELVWYARVDNLTDRAARPAASLLTQTAPERAWLAGRSLRLGVRAEF